ncbi:MAG: hypothetical protein VX341_10970, partial [Bdellovibrionota bacterium]|nr:hypothetical protein [Bdellovibrionota bacterium]
MKRILISFILLQFLLSCSNQPKFLIDRTPSSVEEVKRSCINLVKIIFGNAEVDPLAIFNKIDNDEKLNLSERKFLKKYLYLIESTDERLFISKKISSNKSLDNHEKSIIRKFVEDAVLKDQSLNKKIYRRRYVAGRTDLPISYGLEIELLLNETPDILKQYRLNNYSEDEWAQLSIEEKLSEALEQVKVSDAYSELFSKMPSAHDSLPNTLFIEGHKTVEANNIVFNTLGEAQDFLKYFDKSVGRGSVQGHVVYPDKVEIDGAAGFVVFEADYAQLHNLERGYDRLLKNPETTPANNLIHHALGPLSEDERLLYIVNQDALINQEQFNNIGKAKTVYGVNFRAGKPYEDGYVGFEHRQYHKNYERLVDGMDYQSRELEKKGDLSRYKDFEDAPQIDSSLISARIDEYQIDLDKDDLELFLISAGEVIEKKSKEMGFTFGGAQPEHRFLFPLKDWINNPILNEMPESIRKEYE